MSLYRMKSIANTKPVITYIVVERHLIIMCVKAIFLVEEKNKVLLNCFGTNEI